MKYNVKVIRTWTTYIEVEAESPAEAELLVAMNDATRDRLYDEELNQCNTEDTLIEAQSIQ
jgi:hypothetical protein